MKKLSINFTNKFLLTMFVFSSCLSGAYSMQYGSHLFRREHTGSGDRVWVTPKSLGVNFPMEYSCFNFDNTMPKLPEYSVFIQDINIGDNVDSLWGAAYLARNLGDALVLGTTNFWHPEERAKMLKIVYGSMRACASVSSGYGVFLDKEDMFLDLYPCWPQEKFGIPGKTNRLSLLQPEVFRKWFGNFNEFEFSYDTAVVDIIKKAHIYENSLIIVSQSSLTNIALAYLSAPIVMSKINRIIMADKPVCDSDGNIAKLGYGIALDLEAAKIILEQRDIPVFIISSEVCKQFILQESEREDLALLKTNKVFSLALYEEMQNCWLNKIPAKTPLEMIDLLTSYIALHPEVVSQIQPVRFEFDGVLLKKITEEHIDMFNSLLGNVMTFDSVDKSNVYIVTQLYEPELIRKTLVEEIKKMMQ